MTNKKHSHLKMHYKAKKTPRINVLCLYLRSRLVRVSVFVDENNNNSLNAVCGLFELIAPLRDR